MGKLGKEIKGAAEDAVTGDSGALSTMRTDSITPDIKKLKEEEDQKKREEANMQRLRSIMEEEERFYKFNSLKIKYAWRVILRGRKTKELLKQIDILAQTHDRQVDRKDAVIQMLYRDLEEAEEQYRFALQTHLQHIDELLRLQEKREKSLEAEFKNDLKILKEEFESERMEIIARHKEEVEELNQVFAEMKKRAEILEQEMNIEFTNKYEAEKNKYQEELNVMTMMMKDTNAKYQEQIKEENEKHIETMDTKYKEYRVLLNKSDSHAEEIKKQMTKLKNLEESLNHWRAKWLNNLRECEERNQRLMDEKNALAKHYKSLKKKMIKFRESEKICLQELVKMSRKTRKILEEKLKRAERILSIAELCRKLETEREKILPFGQEEAQPVEEDEEKLHEGIENIAQLHQHAVRQEWEQMSKFYKKYNKVLLDQIALTEEKEHLLEENRKLRQALKSYFDQISVNNDVMNEQNPLLIIDQIQGAQRKALVHQFVSNQQQQQQQYV